MIAQTDGVFYSLYINVSNPSCWEKLLFASLLEKW